jgi:hypothetical protein
MTAARTGARSSTTFLVDGTAYGGGPITYDYDRRWAIGSDAGAAENALVDLRPQAMR